MLCKREKTCVATSKIDVNCVTTNLSSKKKKCFNNKVHGKYGMVHIIQQGCKDNQGCIRLISQKN